MTETYQESIKIHAPVDVCYHCWREFACFSAYMHNVKEVIQLEDNVWRWVLLGPHGDVSHWDLVLAEEVPNTLISWKTLNGPEIDMNVDVYFEALQANLTQITINLESSPPDTPIGQVVHNLFGVTDRALLRNLREFKSVVEGMMARNGAETNRGIPANEREPQLKVRASDF